MPKTADIEPRWLVSLLKKWAIYEELRRTNGLGYSSGSNWMRGLKSSPASSIEAPTGFCSTDFVDLQKGIDHMQETALDLISAVLMYHKPWIVQAYRDAGYPFGNSTYFHRLHKGHRELAKIMDGYRIARLERVKAVLNAGTVDNKLLQQSAEEMD